MKRRAFLAGAASLATAGCLGPTVGGDPGGTTDSGTTDRTTTEQTTSGDDATSDDHTTDDDCPAVRREVDTTLCAGDRPGFPASFSQSAAAVSSNGDLSFTLTNEAAGSVGLNPYAWAVHRRTEKGWRHVAPDAVIQPWRTLGEGDAQTWRLAVGDPVTADDTETETTTERTTSEGSEPVGAGPLDLSPGEYAFSVVADVDGDSVAFVARFTVE
jgi:hypothetical protein